MHQLDGFNPSLLVLESQGQNGATHVLVPRKRSLVSLTCPEQNDLVLQGEVREMGQYAGPFNEAKAWTAA